MTIFFDFDSTLVSKESLDEVIALALAEADGRAELLREVEEITKAGMEGTLPFTESVRRRLAVVPLWHRHFEAVGDTLTQHITADMPNLVAELQAAGHHVYIISGGFRDSILPVAKVLGIDPQRVFANHCRYDGHGRVLSVTTDNPCFTDDGKMPVIEAIVAAASPPRPYLMIGDGGNDLKAYTSGTVEHFCGYTEHVSRDIVRQSGVPCAASVSALRDFILSLPAV